MAFENYGINNQIIWKSGGKYMNIYTTDKIRNVALLGHGGSGKSSLAEAMAYLSGITSRMGKIEIRSAITAKKNRSEKFQSAPP